MQKSSLIHQFNREIQPILESHDLGGDTNF